VLIVRFSSVRKKVSTIFLPAAVVEGITARNYQESAARDGIEVDNSKRLRLGPAGSPRYYALMV
jgi:hypothetical protein